MYMHFKMNSTCLGCTNYKLRTYLSADEQQSSSITISQNQLLFYPKNSTPINPENHFLTTISHHKTSSTCHMRPPPNYKHDLGRGTICLAYDWNHITLCSTHLSFFVLLISSFILLSCNNLAIYNVGRRTKEVQDIQRFGQIWQSDTWEGSKWREYVEYNTTMLLVGEEDCWFTRPH